MVVNPNRRQRQGTASRSPQPMTKAKLKQFEQKRAKLRKGVHLGRKQSKLSCSFNVVSRMKPSIRLRASKTRVNAPIAQSGLHSLDYSLGRPPKIWLSLLLAPGDSSNMASKQTLGKRVRQFLIVVGSSFIAIILAMWLAIVIIKPGPQGRIVMAAGGADGAYLRLTETWKRELARFGVTLELRDDLQGLDTVQALAADNRTVDAGVIKGGLAGSLQGRLATPSEREIHDAQVGRIQSLGRLFYEPIWVFYRGPNLVRSLGEFKGRRIMVGTPASGTRRIAALLLRANGVTAENSTFIEQDFPADAKPLTGGDGGDGADVAFVALPPEARRVQDLLRAPDILLMDFSAEAEAYTTRFPFLSKLVMFRGSVEFAPDLPSADITLLASAPALVVRKDLHPALMSLLTHTSAVNHKPGFDPMGEPILFFRAGQFPNGNDPEFEIDPDSRTYYKTGELP